MTKTHLIKRDGYPYTACRRYVNGPSKKVRTSTATSRVTCGTCKVTEQFAQSDARQRLAAAQAFEAQEPREYREPWRDGTITCTRCGGTLFRYVGRSCYGHYDDYQCANDGCRESASRLTETGMSA